jgi:signal transduction histidine kinase/ActR/RegA family two-component response regulator
LKNRLAILRRSFTFVRRYLLAGIIVVLAGIATQLSAVIQQRQSALSSLSGADLSWSFNQLVSELLRFGHSLGAKLADVSSPELKLDERYEILLSRLEHMREGEDYRAYLVAEPAAASLFDKIYVTVLAMQPHVSGDRDALQRAFLEVSRLTPQAVELAARASSFRVYRASAHQTDLLHLHWAFSGVSATAACFGLLQLFSLARHNRRLQRLQLDLSAQNARFDATISNIPLGIALVDDSGRLLIRNRQLAPILGIASTELTAGCTTLQPLVGEANRNAESTAQPGGQVLELADGRSLAVTVCGMAEGGSVLVVEDVTHRLRADEQRKQLEAQLQQAQKMEAVGQLTGGIAHDFNNLLTVVIGNAEILLDEPEDAHAVRTLAAMVLEAAERGADLTNKLLAFGRRQSLSPEMIDVSQCVEAMLPLLKRVVNEGVELRTDFSPSAVVHADRSLLESALLNLVVNARDALAAGGSLTISTGERDLREGTAAPPSLRRAVFLSVSDTGTGMPPDVLRRAFEPFFTTKEVGKGSGLGLSMVYGFCEQSGGTVQVESTEGMGTTVTMYLPAVQVDDLGGKQQSPSRSDAVALTGGGGRVLVVEDDPQVLEFAARELTRLGYAVTTADNGAQAMELLAQGQRYDILFADVVLPDGPNGVELARSVQRHHPGMRVVLASGYAEDIFATYGKPDGDTVVLKKPYKRPELAEALVRRAGASAAT